MNKFFLNILVVSLTAISPLANLHAEQSVFSADGKTIYDSSDNSYPPLALRVIDLHQKTIRDLPLEQIGISGDVQGFSRDNRERILIVTKTALWAFDPKTSKSDKICDAPDGVQFDDVAFNPKTKGILITANAQHNGQRSSSSVFYSIKSGTKALIPGDSRRVYFMRSPIFDSKGNLFFGVRGDLWIGTIDWHNENYPDHPILEAYRIAPVASLETQNTAPGSTGVQEIAVASDWVYLGMTRMGGSGWGSVAKLKRPNYEKSLLGSADAKTYLDELRSFQELADSNYPCISSSRDGKYVYFRGSLKNEPQSKDCLVINNGAPKPLDLRILDAK